MAADATLSACAAISDAARRLACYDDIAGRAATPAAADSGSQPNGSPSSAAGAAPQQLAPTGGSSNAGDAAAASGSGPRAVPVGGVPAPETVAGSGVLAENARQPSLLASFWELDPEDKRGTFRFLSYRPNYFLPVHYTNRINRSPTSPALNRTGSLPNYRQLETKLQISIRTKIAQDLFLPNADLWFAFTQQSLWQLWNKQESSPFRATDYEPEAIYVVPVPSSLRSLPWGWQFRMVQAGIAHQSNGQTIPLSRSWNRVYLGAGFERGDVSLSLRAIKRLKEEPDQDDNPDITNYRGRGDVLLTWAPGNATASLLYRTTFKNTQRGAVQFDWTYPVERSKPRGLRWYVQVFSGYGETMLDYNFRQTSFGAGLSLFEF